MKNIKKRGRSGRARRTLAAKETLLQCTARQALKSMFYHLDAARFIMLAHRLHLEAS